MGRWLIIFGVVLIVVGLLWPVLQRMGLGRLPGDIAWQGKNGSFYFPIVSCIVLSLVLTLGMWLLGKFRG